MGLEVDIFDKRKAAKDQLHASLWFCILQLTVSGRVLNIVRLAGDAAGAGSVAGESGLEREGTCS